MWKQVEGSFTLTHLLKSLARHCYWAQRGLYFKMSSVGENRLSHNIAYLILR